MQIQYAVFQLYTYYNESRATNTGKICIFINISFVYSDFICNKVQGVPANFRKNLFDSWGIFSLLDASASQLLQNSQTNAITHRHLPLF